MTDIKYICINRTTGKSNFNLCWSIDLFIVSIIWYDKIVDRDAHIIQMISRIVATHIGILMNTMIAAHGINGAIEYPKIAICIINVDLHHTLLIKWFNIAIG